MSKVTDKLQESIWGRLLLCVFTILYIIWIPLSITLTLLTFITICPLLWILFGSNAEGIIKSLLGIHILYGGWNFITEDY